MTHPERRRGPARGATSSTVAEAAGVAQSTVSRALRGDPRVREDTRRLIEETADRLGYRPSWAALAPAKNAPARTRSIAVVASDLTNPFFPTLLNPMHDELQLMGYRFVLFAERTDLPTGQEALLSLLNSSIDGVLLTTATLDSQLGPALAERDLPIVLLNRYVDGMDVDRVTADNHHGGRTAARHLLELGHRRIGVIRGPANTSTSRDRYAGVREGIAGFDVSLEIKEGPYSHQSGYQNARDLLRLPEPPTALLCGNDIIAFGAIDAVKSLGLDVPGDVSVLGFDDVPMASWEVFQLTTVHQPLSEMARAAARLLVERIEHDGDIGAGRERLFATSLVQRSTTQRHGGSLL
ncbi:LacI family transcriptional regulator [Actinoplanes bogorensis]|uniref:LacI family transcriptional regulator n=1 Tax=Paractinoplanes bogorensis TaxID=1610840 RepID=A0ABS5YKN1_9ACTN|nr:LacI family DNA-binding transcriptional regulator [Actinoplanes bogorensis]MBU2664034.1 LacI family transcriptional regulator [Actinoplanes bogorensis]